MKSRSEKRNVDPKLHVRKKTVGLTSGAILGGTVAGPLGALVGAAVGTLVGDAAEEGRRLPKEITNRIQKPDLRSGFTKARSALKRSRSRKSTTSSPRSKRSSSSRSSSTRRTKKKK